MAGGACGKFQGRNESGEHGVTGLLISVSNMHEAKLALGAGVDILDMKNPAAGALGRLELTDIAGIVAATGKNCVTSATVGDLPMQPDLLANAVQEVMATGVDIVKVGFFGGEQSEACAREVGRFATAEVRLVAVLMADMQPDFSLIPVLKAAGFDGAMLDTANKKNGSLLDCMAAQDIESFCDVAQAQKLLTGLAGSLREAHIAKLLDFRPDYLGFRGAVCAESNRQNDLDVGRLKSIRSLLHKYNNARREALMH
ncbi:MAG: hypothetical protein CVU15_08045 [Betaproteobacteria bacterium HGW-Betaproteobacteria-1]|jgi:uncharacterized protein (UPF0264 family)|nr:MAG: hypothetical protein CVU15_08045 [Betaproteobacteria bacterium HGW-Betaproteobacteria-1]